MDTFKIIKYHSFYPQTLQEIKILDNELMIKINSTLGGPHSPISTLIPTETFDLNCVDITNNYLTTSPYMLENYKEGERIRIKQIPTETNNQLIEFSFVFGIQEVIIRESTICDPISDEYQKIFSNNSE